ncbi:IclR family transcriptional regulator [Streptomyces sp. TLI_55]|uniref:IclR family transcriptional regulator n=1 Tax=Streptomyces sp. TLI_55 TaxID=1938861 RepID=UPI000BCD1A0F|nr:IclR family transcriptional regulator [Streptomyces sp. TLI_55]SNX66034.1 IclR family transcriptional regulator [Streptomyces sp. TLI_55]
MSSPHAPPDRSVVERTLGVLGAFDTAHVSLTVSQISSRSKIPVATTYRIVSKLVSWGALERAEDNKYTIGLRLWEVSQLAPRHADLRAAAVPAMFDLRSTTRRAVLLSTRDGIEGICLESVSGSARPLHRSWSRGHRFPLHATACGRVLLAAAGTTVQDELYGGELRPYTERTVRTPAVLRDLVAHTRRQGYAVSDGELLDGVVEIAAPVHGGDGAVLGAIGLITVGTASTAVPDAVGHLLAAARRVSRSLADAPAPGGNAVPSPRTARSRMHRPQGACA